MPHGFDASLAALGQRSPDNQVGSEPERADAEAVEGGPTDRGEQCGRNAGAVYPDAMTEADGFDAWYDSISPDLGDGWSKREKRERESWLRDWLRRFYISNGPANEEVVRAAFGLDQLALAEANVAIVMSDIERTTDLRPKVVVNDLDEAVCICFNGNYTSPSVFAWDNPEALAEVADYLQEHVMEALWRTWPECPEHDFGLFPQVRQGEAVWWCRPQEHAVAAVGHLGEATTAARAR